MLILYIYIISLSKHLCSYNLQRQIKRGVKIEQLESHMCCNFGYLRNKEMSYWLINKSWEVRWIFHRFEQKQNHSVVKWSQAAAAMLIKPKLPRVLLLTPLALLIIVLFYSKPAMMSLFTAHAFVTKKCCLFLLFRDVFW